MWWVDGEVDLALQRDRPAVARSVLASLPSAGQSAEPGRSSQMK